MVTDTHTHIHIQTDVQKTDPASPMTGLGKNEQGLVWRSFKLRSSESSTSTV